MSGEKGKEYSGAEQTAIRPDTPGTSGMPGGSAFISGAKKEPRFQYMVKKYIEKKRKLISVDITTVEPNAWLWKVIYDGLTPEHVKVHGMEEVSTLSFIEYLFDDSWI